ncbi:MAG: HNH endonuclease family protein, partial [Actinomycetota bacterium]|nr:HNH endonuclease family protein [Actinomycetota bacterium]
VLRGPLREADVYDTVQDIAKSEQGTVNFTTTLENLANVYVATFNPEHQRWNAYPRATRRAIEVFNLFNIRPMRPLILAVAAKMEEKESSRSFEFLIALSVRLVIAGNTRSGTVEVSLSSTARDVFEGVIETANQLQKKLSSLTPTDQEFQRAFETTKVSNARLARYYLRSLEMSAKNETEPWFVPHDDQTVINLEHVLPRKPDGNWPGFSEEDVHQYATRLGNLALLRARNNSDLKNQGFAAKRQTYSKSPYVLTSQIGDIYNWTPEEISHRQKGLASLAVTTWPAKLR